MANPRLTAGSWLSTNDQLKRIPAADSLKQHAVSALDYGMKFKLNMTVHKPRAWLPHYGSYHGFDDLWQQPTMKATLKLSLAAC